MHDRHDPHDAHQRKQRDHDNGEVQPSLSLLADAVEVGLGVQGDVGPVAGPALDCGGVGGGVDAVEERGCDDGGYETDEGGAESEEGMN